MPSERTHLLCDDCWDRRRPESPSPRRGQGEPGACCDCATPTRSGIYFRSMPADIACGGQTGIHAVPVGWEHE